MPRFSIVVPIYPMKNGDYFLSRLMQSIRGQSFTDYEIVISNEGSMPINTNRGMKSARGELIKILFMDDYFAHADALQVIHDNFKEEDIWLATGCVHQKTGARDFYEDPHSPHYPKYTKDISTGNNQIGSPSVVTLRNEGHLDFDENLSFALDCDLYKRYHDTYGLPKTIRDLNIVIGIHDGQTSYLMSDEEKMSEFEYMKKKHDTDS